MVNHSAGYPLSIAPSAQLMVINPNCASAIHLERCYCWKAHLHNHHVVPPDRTQLLPLRCAGMSERNNMLRHYTEGNMAALLGH